MTQLNQLVIHCVNNNIPFSFSEDQIEIGRSFYFSAFNKEDLFFFSPEGSLYKNVSIDEAIAIVDSIKSLDDCEKFHLAYFIQANKNKFEFTSPDFWQRFRTDRFVTNIGDIHKILNSLSYISNYNSVSILINGESEYSFLIKDQMYVIEHKNGGSISFYSWNPFFAQINHICKEVRAGRIR